MLTAVNDFNLLVVGLVVTGALELLRRVTAVPDAWLRRKLGRGEQIRGPVHELIPPTCAVDRLIFVVCLAGGAASVP